VVSNWHVGPDYLRGPLTRLVHWENYPGNPIIQNNRSSAIPVSTPQGEDRLDTMHPDVKVFRSK
jgi:hypothetical protein